MKPHDLPQPVELMARRLHDLFGPATERRKPPAARSAPPGEVDPRALRLRLGLSQAGFARRYGLALPALIKWEQRLRRPDMAARTYLAVIARDPRHVAALVAGGRASGLGDLTLAELRAQLDAADAAEADPPDPPQRRRRP